MKHQNSPRTRIACAFVCAVLALVGTGCSSIVHGGNRKLTIGSTPAGAKVTVIKAGTDVVIHSSTTPCTVSLDPRGGYFKGQAYKLKFELEGYKAAELDVRPQLSGWYFGNIVFGGLIGMIVVDPLTGSMWNLSPEKIEQPLTSEQTALIKNGDGFLVVLRSEITDGEKASMVKIN